MGLRRALDRMDALDVGDVAQDFYFLRHVTDKIWAVHFRTNNKSDWRVSRDERLAVAIENALIDMEENPFVGQEHRHGEHDITPDDWEDLI